MSDPHYTTADVLVRATGRHVVYCVGMAFGPLTPVTIAAGLITAEQLAVLQAHPELSVKVGATRSGRKRSA